MVKVAINEDYCIYGLISNVTKIRPTCGRDVLGMWLGCALGQAALRPQ